MDYLVLQEHDISLNDKKRLGLPVVYRLFTVGKCGSKKEAENYMNSKQITGDVDEFIVIKGKMQELEGKKRVDIKFNITIKALSESWNKFKP